MILLYNTLLFLAAGLGLPLILPAVLFSGKLRRVFLYRMGLKRLPAAIGGPAACKKKKGAIWIHALSVGEVLSAVPLAKALKNKTENYDVFFSVSTRTGYSVAGSRLAGIADAIFFSPYDLVFLVKYVVNRINPSIVIIVETDIWPNFLHELTRRHVPVVLINARLSKRSFRRHKRFSFFSRWIFSDFSRICVQSAQNAEYFQQLGIPPGRIIVTGNVKFDQKYDPISDEQIQNWRRQLKIVSGKKIWLAGSTHEGEEAVVKDVFVRLRHYHKDLALIVAPRDPQRALAVVRLFQQAGVTATSVSKLCSPDEGRPADVIVVDTIGDLRALYALADMAFIGGSLVDRGGHNPLEPAAFSRPVLFGPDMSDFAPIARLLLESGGARQVRDAAELFAAVNLMMENRLKAVEMGQNAYRVFCENKGAVARNLEIILNELPEKQSSIRHDG